jgi:hypothetical protein
MGCPRRGANCCNASLGQMACAIIRKVGRPFGLNRLFYQNNVFGFVQDFCERCLQF